MDRTLDQHFLPDEREGLSGRAPPTIAGFVALKNALLALARDLEMDRGLDTRAIVLGHGRDGEPQVLSFPATGGRLFVSVSHDRTTAWGLAVFQGGNGD